MSVEQAAPPSYLRSRRLALLALLLAASSWIVFLILEKVFPAHAASIGILAMAAEAGVVGGLADWYAVTVLFRNPFGKIPLPRLLSEHTEIIPRNKARIAESMGRFVQENFLAPDIVRKSLQQTDVSLHIAHWLSDSDNVDMVTDFIQRVTPRLLQFLEGEDIAKFLQDNAVAWVKSTPAHRLSSEILRSVLENDFHDETLQNALDAAEKWIKANPDKAHALATTIFDELGVGTLARGASLLGFDLQKRIIDTFMAQVQNLLENKEHPWRVALEERAKTLMKELRRKNSNSSKRVNNAKNMLVESEASVRFMTGAISILREAIKKDLESDDSGIAENLHGILVRLGEKLAGDERVRAALNQEIEEAIISFADNYAENIIAYVRDKIHDWDTREMIEKIETEVGGDLHMIRVNGVVVGAFIGLLLGLGRVIFDSLPF